MISKKIYISLLLTLGFITPFEGWSEVHRTSGPLTRKAINKNKNESISEAKVPVSPGPARRRVWPKSQKVPELSPSLRSSIVVAKNVDPEAYAEFKEELQIIQNVCHDAPKMIRSIKDAPAGFTTKKDVELNRHVLENLPKNINRSLAGVIRRLEKSAEVENLCLETFFQMNLLKFSKVEGINYLKSILDDVDNENYGACSAKLKALLAAGEDS
jgi:hypothetical protein